MATMDEVHVGNIRVFVEHGYAVVWIKNDRVRMTLAQCDELIAALTTARTELAG